MTNLMCWIYQPENIVHHVVFPLALMNQSAGFPCSRVIHHSLGKNHVLWLNQKMFWSQSKKRLPYFYLQTQPLLLRHRLYLVCKVHPETPSNPSQQGDVAYLNYVPVERCSSCIQSRCPTYAWRFWWSSLTSSCLRHRQLYAERYSPNPNYTRRFHHHWCVTWFQYIGLSYAQRPCADCCNEYYKGL